VIYEAHAKGLTMRHPGLPEELRGTYAALAHPAVIEHLTGLGVTALELMPVHQFVDDHRLADLGLRNYWGYNTIGFFAPHNAYASWGDRGQQVLEFTSVVRALHEDGVPAAPGPPVAAGTRLALLDRSLRVLQRPA
jgi:isoamylase